METVAIFWNILLQLSLVNVQTGAPSEIQTHLFVFLFFGASDFSLKMSIVLNPFDTKDIFFEANFKGEDIQKTFLWAGFRLLVFTLLIRWLRSAYACVFLHQW